MFGFTDFLLATCSFLSLSEWWELDLPYLLTISLSACNLTGDRLYMGDFNSFTNSGFIDSFVGDFIADFLGVLAGDIDLDAFDSLSVFCLDLLVFSSMSRISNFFIKCF